MGHGADLHRATAKIKRSSPGTKGFFRGWILEKGF